MSRPLRGLFSVIQHRGGRHFLGRHVKAHEGHPWNELADTAANRFRCDNTPMLGLCSIAMAFRSVDWAWAPSIETLGMPPLAYGPNGASWVLNRHRGLGPLPTSAIPMHGDEHTPSAMPDEDSSWLGLSIKALCANVQSMAGKHKYLEAQLVRGEFDIAFFQETKIKGGLFSTSSFHRFASEHDSHWGVAIWIRKSLVINGNLTAITLSDCRVLCSEPRLLAITIQVCGVSVLCVAAHLPQQQHGHDPRSALYKSITALLNAPRQFDIVLFGVDANARLPCGFNGVTGEVEHGEPDQYGFDFVEFLANVSLWVPATFSACHSGTSATWRHPHGHTSRIDFLCIGGTASHEGVHSWTDTDFDLLTAADDHGAVAVSGYFWICKAAHGHDILLRRRYDVSKLTSSEGQQCISDALHEIANVPWSVDVNSHAAYIEQAAHGILIKHFSIPQGSPRSTYISEAVWEKRTQRNILKARTRFWKDGHKTALLREGFTRLAGGTCASGWWVKVDLLYHVFAAAIRYSTEWIKRQIRTDKKVLLTRRAGGAEGFSTVAIQKALKRCGLGRRNVGKGGRPVPFLLNKDGQPIVSRQDLDRRWLEHFGHMEAGHSIAISQFRHLVESFRPGHDVSIDLSLVPSFLDVEQQFRNVRCGAAAGLDGLPPELFKAAPQEMARLFHPLMAKAALHIAQPIQWRGGVLFEAYKRNGSPSLAENYRSLFVSSVPGKCFHRIVRDRASGLIEDTLDTLHCGGRKRRPVTLPSLAAHLIARMYRDRHCSLCSIFLDTKSAYYRVVRELAFGTLEDDSAVIQLFHRFGVPPEALHDLMSVVHHGGVMAQNGLQAHHRALVQDMHDLSWFITPYSDGSMVGLSKAGSRPGESWADIVFAFVYHKVLSGIRDIADAEKLTLQIPFAGTQSPFLAANSHDAITGPLHATWADDSVFFTGDACALISLQNAKRLAGIVLDGCRRHGMQPNLKKGKSAIVLALRGKHSRAVRKLHFQKAADCLEIDTASGEPDRIHLELQYTHLGTALHKDGSMLPEARLRLGIASTAYTKYGKLLLSNPEVDLKLRVQFFDSLVGGVFFNLALWVPCCKGWSHLDKGYALLQRRLLRAHVRHEDTQSVRCSDVAAILGMPTLYLICRMRRLNFFSSLVAVGNDSIWALLQSEGSWIRQICDDLRWPWATAQLEMPCPAADSWDQWRSYILDRQNNFRSAVKRAGRIAQKQERLEALCIRTLRRLGQWELQESPDRIHVLSQPYWCGPCLRAFSSKAALATHFFQMHGRVARFRHLARGDACNACGRRFRGFPQLALHLRGSKACCDSLSADGYWQDAVLPGIGSATWAEARRKDLGLTLPTEPQYIAGSSSNGELCWTESTTLMAAHLDGVEFWLDSDHRGPDALFQYCMFLTEFPLFPDELQLVVGATVDTLSSFGCNLDVDVWTGVQKFFSGEAETCLTVDIDSAVLEDHFWREPPLCRPSPSGTWRTISNVLEFEEDTLLEGDRIWLLDSWHQGNWPPGFLTTCDTADCLQPQVQKCLLYILQALSLKWGWLRAPEDFWNSAISIPFARFHHACN